MKNKFYISTSITYASGKPHIGNTYEVILADAIARYQRIIGKEVYFQTGTDEHGQKVQTKAEERGITPQEFVDETQKEIQRIWDLVDTSYDKFVRTTDSNHKEIVSKIFEKLYKQGDIYKGEYKGLYCVACESFYTENQLIDGKCPDCGKEVEEASEEAYFLKLDKYAPRLIKYIEEHPEFLQPETRKNEMINSYLKPGLQDLCVSRTSFDWGVPVTFDHDHVVYVWIDALSNYITFLGYDPEGSSENFNHFWPADVHLIGKDIFKFHSIYWPIMLMALDLPLPKTVFGHPWILMNGDKMSKSSGNTLYADDLVEKYGVDPVRYYVLKEVPFANDGIINDELIVERYNADLVNNLANLVNRTIKMSQKYFAGKVENPKVQEEIDENLINDLKATVSNVDKYMNSYQVAKALNEIISMLRKTNKYIDETTPWLLGKDEAQSDRLQTIIYNLLESIRINAILLSSFLPNTAETILDQLNTKQRNYKSIQTFGNLETDIILPEAKHLFERIDQNE